MQLQPYNDTNIVLFKNENKPNCFCHDHFIEMFEMIA